MTATRTNGTRIAVAVLRSRGFAVCKPDPGTKKPTYTGWSTRSLEPDDFADDDLVGIVCGPLSDCGLPGHALVIPDLDSPQAVELADEYLPPTDMQEGRPGKPRSHRGYLVPFDTIPAWARSEAEQGAAAAQAQKGHPGPFKKAFNHATTKRRVIDFLGTGGQAVVPPSTWVSEDGERTERREWVGGRPGQPAVVPFEDLWEAVCDLAEACGCNPPETGQPTHEGNGKAAAGAFARLKAADRPNARRRAVAYLATVDPAVSKQGGHPQTLWAARCMVRGFLLGLDEGFDLLWAEYNPRCQPPWSEKDLRRKCQQAADRPFRHPPGWLLNQDREGRTAGGTDDPPADVHLTDLGNARRVVIDHGHELRYCHPWKRFVVWDGRRWAEDETGAAVRMVKDTQGGLYRWAARRLEQLADAKDDERKAEAAALTQVLNHAFKWEDARRISASLELVKSERGIPVLPADLDRDPWLFNVRNGTLDLRAGTLREHRREDLLTKLAPVDYDPNAACPLWLKFLHRVMDDKTGLIRYLQRVVGYSLTADVREQCLFFFHGAGANGKSTFLSAVLGALGDYGCQAVSELLLQKSHESHPAERADLVGKRLVATIETDEGKRMAEALMKQLTGGDKVKARKMRQDFFEFAPTWKIFLAANHKPNVRGTDHAVWRRIKLVPFTVTIPETEKDKALGDKLKAEWPGILAWAVRGCLDWQREGLAEPEEVREATRQYRCEQDQISNFLDACCNLHPQARIKVSTLFEAYAEWSGDRATRQRDFTERLKEMGYPSERGTGGYWFYRGIGLPAPEDKRSDGR